MKSALYRFAKSNSHAMMIDDRKMNNKKVAYGVVQFLPILLTLYLLRKSYEIFGIIRPEDSEIDVSSPCVKEIYHKAPLMIFFYM